MRLPGDVSEILIQARSLGVGFTLAHQHLGQLAGPLQAAVLANARSRVLFQLEAADARVFATGHPELEPLDLMNLPPFEAYTSLLRDNQVQPYVSLRTEPPPPVTADPSELRAMSSLRFGRSRGDTDAALQALLGAASSVDDEPLGSRPRRQL